MSHYSLHNRRAFKRDLFDMALVYTAVGVAVLMSFPFMRFMA